MKISNALFALMLFLSYSVNAQDIQTKDLTESDSVPDRPLNLVATAVSDSVIHLTWDDVDNEDSYTIYYRHGYAGAFNVIDTTTVNITQYDHSGLLPLSFGCYMVAAKNLDGWSPSSDIACASTLASLREATFSSQPLHIFPNPATTRITLQLPPQFEQATKLEVFDRIGQLVLRIDYSSEVDVSALPAGLYFLVVCNGDGERVTGRFVKE
jgi:hypothetical protein